MYSLVSHTNFHNSFESLPNTPLYFLVPLVSTSPSFTATSAFQYSTPNKTWKSTDSSMYKTVWHQTTQNRKGMMCANNLYNDGMMNAFVDSFPVSFVEPYFVCRKTVLSSLKDAVGNAAGTAGMVAAVAMAIFGMIFRKVCYPYIHSPHDFSPYPLTSPSPSPLYAPN